MPTRDRAYGTGWTWQGLKINAYVASPEWGGGQLAYFCRCCGKSDRTRSGVDQLGVCGCVQNCGGDRCTVVVPHRVLQHRTHAEPSEPVQSDDGGFCRTSGGCQCVIVYDLFRRLVATLVGAVQVPGEYRLRRSGANARGFCLAARAYRYTLKMEARHGQGGYSTRNDAE